MAFMGTDALKVELVIFTFRYIVPTISQCSVTSEPALLKVEEGNGTHIAAQTIAKAAGSNKISLVSSTVTPWNIVFSSYGVAWYMTTVFILMAHHGVTTVTTSVVLRF
jgi:hypothetical protein